MRITFLVFNIDGMGGTSRSAITQANALAGLGHEVELLSVTRSAEASHYRIDPAVTVTRLIDVRDPTRPGLSGLAPDEAARLQVRGSVLVPHRWDPQYSALCDLALSRHLPGLRADVLVTVTPALLAAAVQLSPGEVAVVHQEHRSSSDRTGGLEPLLTFGPRADVVALLTPSVETWLRDRLGELAPTTVVMPNPLPQGYTPRSSRERPLVVTGGRLVGEKQFQRLVESFGLVAARMPGWRLRICGDGPGRGELLRQQRKSGLWDRLELPGAVDDMALEWGQASVAALASRTEGYPLVLQEAMAAGVPPVSFDAPSGPREIIDHEVNGLLVAPQSTGAMAAALLRLATDPALRHRLGRGALATAAAWAPETIAERWEAVFDAALARRATGRVTQVPPAGPAAVATAAVVPAVPAITPAAARSAALAAAVAAAGAASTVWLVVPAHERPAPVVVLPMSRRAAFLDALAAAAAGGAVAAYLSLRDPAAHGWPERRGTVADLAAELRRGRTGWLALEPWPSGPAARTSLLAHDTTVEVEFWEADPDGELVAARRNTWADRLPVGLADRLVDAEVDGVAVRSLPLLLAPGVGECRFDIDVVYTWVDGSDPDWDASRRARLDEAGASAELREASGRARFRDRGELRWSLRSLHLFAPWVRRIHLVTAGQVPAWLDTADPRIHLVEHGDLLPGEALPTFNSHAIETALHRIDGLAEHFVYLNDDFLLGRSVRPETFFTPAGQSVVWFSKVPVGLTDQPGAAPFLAAAHTNRRLLHDAFGVALTGNLAHAPYPHRVSVLREVAERFAAEVEATARSPFRSPADVSTASSLAQHVGLVTGAAVTGDLAEHPLAYVNLSNADVEAQLRRLLSREQDFVCLADHHDQAVGEDTVAALLDDVLGRYYPIAAPWER